MFATSRHLKEDRQRDNFAAYNSERRRKHVHDAKVIFEIIDNVEEAGSWKRTLGGPCIEYHRQLRGPSNERYLFAGRLKFTGVFCSATGKWMISAEARSRSARETEVKRTEHLIPPNSTQSNGFECGISRRVSRGISLSRKVQLMFGSLLGMNTGSQRSCRGLHCQV